MSATTRDRRHQVVVLVRPGLLVMELGIVHRLFGEARSAEGTPLYRVRTCAPHPGDLRTDSDISIAVTHGPELLAEADTVVVPASDEDYEQDRDTRDPRLAAALAAVPRGARVASICTGSFVLAAAGLLDGLRATTHWRSAESFRALFPGVALCEDVLYTDEGRVLTAAGVASGIDLCLHMIRGDHGAAVANEVARGTVVSPHRDGGQAQFISRSVRESRYADPDTGEARAWALEHLAEPIDLGALATRVSMSTRTFTRKFREETGLTPMDWLTRQRIEEARRLLEETDLPVEQVAANAGFGTAVSLRQHLRRTVGLSPIAYRGTFRGTFRDTDAS